MWKCSVCETVNEDTEKRCRVCGNDSPLYRSEEKIRKEVKRSFVRIVVICVIGGILGLLLLGMLFGEILPEFSGRQHDQEVAERVAERIDDLSIGSYPDSDEVEKVRDLYDKLTVEQKKYVENYEDLEAAEEEVAAAMRSSEGTEADSPAEAAGMTVQPGRVRRGGW